VLVVEEGTGDSVKCRDSAYRQIIVQHADEYGLSPGDFTTLEVTDSQTMYTFGTPVDEADGDADRAAAGDGAETTTDEADTLQPQQ
jgi:hypothetical protein